MMIAPAPVMFFILVIIKASVGQTTLPECVKSKNPLGECCGDEQLWINENCTQVKNLI